jgi:hypothetical protein
VNALDPVEDPAKADWANVRAGLLNVVLDPVANDLEMPNVLRTSSSSLSSSPLKLYCLKLEVGFDEAGFDETGFDETGFDPTLSLVNEELVVFESKDELKVDVGREDVVLDGRVEVIVDEIFCVKE